MWWSTFRWCFISDLLCEFLLDYQMGTPANICCLQLTEMKRTRKYRFCQRSERHWKIWCTSLKRRNWKKNKCACRWLRERSKGAMCQVLRQQQTWPSDRWGHCWVELNISGLRQQRTCQPLCGTVKWKLWNQYSVIFQLSGTPIWRVSPFPPGLLSFSFVF